MSKKKKHAHKNHNNNHNTVQKLAEQKQENKNIVLVKNAEGDPDTTAEIVIQNKIDYEPKVSVIIPVYNVEEYLRECLDSVVNQTLKEIEIICVDDGSTDSSLEILKEYAQKDNRITVIGTLNKNAGHARNIGISIARGKYLGFIDSDDYIEPTMYEELYAKSKKDDLSLVCCQYTVFDHKRNFTEGVFGVNTWAITKFRKDENNNVLITENTPIFQLTNPAPWNKIYKKEFIEKYQILFQEIKSTNDVAFTTQALSLSEKIGVVEKVLYTYRTSTNSSLTDSKNKNLFCFYDAIKEFKNRLEKNELMQRYEDSFFNAVVSYCLYNFSKVDNQSKTILKEFFKKTLFEEFKINNSTTYKIYSDHYRQKILDFLNLKSDPCVSIILPIYNAEPYLRECLDSVVNQTLKDIEIICVNDGSTDNSLDIIKEYAEKDIRIRYIDKPNAGYGHTMNCGLDFATGEYIGIVEPDDYIKLDMYETLYNKAKELDLDIIKSDYYHFEEKNKKFEYKHVPVFRDKTYYNRVLNPNIDTKILYIFTLNPAGIFKNSFLKKYKIKHNETPGAAYQDNGFWAQTMYLANKIYFMDRPFYCYRQDNPNQSIKKKNNINVIPNEYKFIDNMFERNKHISMLKKYYVLRKYYAYLWHLKSKILAEYWEEFIEKFSKDFQIHKNLDEIDENIFPENDLRDIKTLITNPNLFFYKYKFENKNDKAKSVLMLELNMFHGECIPGAAKYFLDLGYNVDVILSEREFGLNPFAIFHDKRVNVFKMNADLIKSIFETNIVKRYDHIYFNSDRYLDSSYYDYLRKNMKFPKGNIITMCHRPEFWNENNFRNKKFKAVSLANLPILKEKNFKVLNTHYFGNISPHKKNKITTFICIGNIESKRKNHSLLIDAVHELKAKGFSNFKIIVIARFGSFKIPTEIESYFEFKGRLSYGDMYNELNNADFFLTLFDPENKEHSRYLSSGTSGSYQLVYGFNIPCIIPEMFATNFNGFTNKNALTYTNEETIGSVMKRAILMNETEYQTMKNMLLKLSDEIYNNSLKNLSFLLDVKRDKSDILLNSQSFLKCYLLFPIYLIKSARAKKKMHKMICRIIRGKLANQFDNTFTLTKQQLTDFALKNNPSPEYVKKNIKRIKNDIYDKFHFRKKYRILGIKFYTKNKHKELVSLLNYTIKKQNNLITTTQTQKNELIGQINQLKNANAELKNNLNIISQANADLKAKVDALSSTIVAVADEFNTQFANQSVYAKKHTAEILAQGKKTQQLVINSKNKILQFVDDEMLDLKDFDNQ